MLGDLSRGFLEFNMMIPMHFELFLTISGVARIEGAENLIGDGMVSAIFCKSLCQPQLASEVLFCQFG